ncbi:MAG: glycosyltransferase [Bacilli bacterium]|nr:glycosyltransferase [Bacilli bacterium]
MNIGLVIVNYNDSDNTIKLIKSVSAFKVIKSIVVVDNNSYTSELNKLKKLKEKKLTIIENDNNYGYAYALNIGAKYINETIQDALICLSNTDIHVANEKVLISMANNIKNDVVCVMPKVKENNSFKYGWKLTSALSDLKANIPLINRLFRKNIIDYPEEYFKDNREVDVIYGCFFMIKGSTLEEIGYFDDKTFLYFEEYILARKLKSRNLKSIVDTSVFVEHIHNAVIGNNISIRNKYKIYKKSQLYYEKKYNKANIFEMTIFRLFYLINLIPYEIKNILKK